MAEDKAIDKANLELALSENNKKIISYIDKIFNNAFDSITEEGFEVKQICTHAQVSSLSAYIASPLDYNPFEFEYLVIDVLTEQPTGNIVKRTILNMSSYINNPSASVSLNCHNGKLACTLDESSIKGTSYRGSWYNIYVDIKGYRSLLFGYIISQKQ